MAGFKIYIAILSVYLFTSCSYILSSNRLEQQQIKALSQKVIFTYLDQCNPHRSRFVGNGLIKIDPILIRRDKLINNGKIHFNYPLSTELLKNPMLKSKQRLTIPDPLRNKYELIKPSEDYERNYSIIHQFSPLLSTNSSNIYLMEHAVWANGCSERQCLRMLLREYIAVKIIKDTIFCQNELTHKTSPDLIVFGGFNREKMEKALPGEKIIKYGSYTTDNH